MKTLKPQRLGLLCRTFESDGRFYFVVSLLVCFPFNAPRSLLTEAEMWKLAGEQLGEDGILDEGLSKVHGEVLVNGRCFTPGGQPRAVTYARVTLGTVDKTIAVFGDRHWKRGVPTDPTPFTEMPLDWTRAFGGPGFAPNPLGKGFAAVPGEGGEVHPLPNVESPKHLVTRPGDRPDPGGFGAYETTWPQRLAKAGTYDAEWLRTRYPGIAKDMDPTFFNVAPDDQSVHGYFRGDEAFLVENMHADRSRIEGRLPGAAARAFIHQKAAHGEVFREIATRLDTVRLFPNVERGILIYRGMIEVVEDDAADVLQLLVACEDPATPRSADHYREALSLRRDPKSRMRAALRDLTDADLMPSPSAGWPAVALPGADVALAEPSPFATNLTRRAEAERAAARAYVEEQGLDPSDYGCAKPAPAERPPGLDDPEALGAYVEQQLVLAEALPARTEDARLQAEADARQLCASLDVDYDAMKAASNARSGGPPKFAAAAQMAMLRGMLDLAREGGMPLVELEAEASDPATLGRLQAAEVAMTTQYRAAAHHLPPAAAPGEEESQVLRALVRAAAEHRESLADRDLTCADLSGLDLQRMDLRRALLEGANLEGANLAGSDLMEAVLARANLTRADLTDAKLVGANLGGARLHDAVFDGADLTGATLMRADLARASLRGARLARADFLEALLSGADLRDIVAPGLTLVRVDLSNVKLAGADLTKGNLIEVELAGAYLAGCRLSGVSFVTVKGAATSFHGANLDRAVFVHGSSLPGADFREASLLGATLRGTGLDRSTFDLAQLDGADLSECSLREASFYRASAMGALLVKTDLSDARMVSINLMDGILQKALLSGTDLTGANLFRADMARVRADSRTKVDGANVNHVRVEPRSRHAQS